nr:MAG TPA: hypothetical protein [Caudoviricetes sp.]
MLTFRLLFVPIRKDNRRSLGSRFRRGRIFNSRLLLFQGTLDLTHDGFGLLRVSVAQTTNLLPNIHLGRVDLSLLPLVSTEESPHALDTTRNHGTNGSRKHGASHISTSIHSRGCKHLLNIETIRVTEVTADSQAVLVLLIATLLLLFLRVILLLIGVHVFLLLVR